MLYTHNIHSGMTLQQRIDQLKSGDVLHIEKGIYEEKLCITTDNITITGDKSGATILQYGDYANKIHEDGEQYGTFRTYSCLIMADDVTMEHITVINDAGDDRKVGQAIALYAEGNKLKFIDCTLIGHQDTLFTGPLPKAPKIPGSFKGPSEDKPYRTLSQYYENCYIVGDIDYIFGSALALFKDCTLLTRNRNETVNGYVTAPSTRQHEPYGYVFYQCDFRGAPGIADESVYFSRPWRSYGQVALVECNSDQCIHKDKWDMWGDEGNRETVTFTTEATLDRIQLNPWHRELLGLG